jgi:hypothetical protein
MAVNLKSKFNALALVAVAQKNGAVTKSAPITEPEISKQSRGDAHHTPANFREPTYKAAYQPLCLQPATKDSCELIFTLENGNRYSIYLYPEKGKYVVLIPSSVHGFSKFADKFMNLELAQFIVKRHRAGKEPNPIAKSLEVHHYQHPLRDSFIRLWDDVVMQEVAWYCH